MSNKWLKFFFWLYLFFLIGMEATKINSADPDLWHRLAVGEIIWTTGHFPTGSTFSYLADYQAIADHEWGSAVIFYALYLWGGLDIFVWVKLLTLTVTMALIVSAGMLGRRPTAITTAFYSLILLALLPSFVSTVRCMIFTHILLALWLYWFQRERNGRPVATVWYPLSMILWANLHGGFAMGLAWLGLLTVIEFGLNRPWRKWAVRLGLCLVATLINPFGFDLWISTLRALLTTRLGFNEWGPVDWTSDVMSYAGYKILLLVLVPTLAVALYQRGWRKIDRSLLLILGVFIGLSLTSARHASLFATVSGALAPGLFPRELKITHVEDPIRRLSYMGLLSSLIIFPFLMPLVSSPGEGFSLRYNSNSCPVDAVAFLKQKGIHGNLLVPFNYGSYALWELRGQMKVSMDGRYDLVYRPETYQRVEDFFFAKGDWVSLLTRPAPQAILVPKEDAIFPKLRNLPEWNEAYHDGTDAVFLSR